MASSSRQALLAVADGWQRVIRFPLGAVTLLLATALVTLPAARTLRASIEDHLGTSTIASTVAAGVDVRWWGEFADDARPGESFRPSMIGAAAPLKTYSDLLDGEGPPPEALAALALGAIAWLFLSGGLLDRYARRRRVGTRDFFGACGVFFFRFLRLTLLTGLAYALLLGLWHGWLFDTVYPWLTRETSVERTAFLWRVFLYLIWLLPVLAVNMVADYAKVRAVLEDRHSAIGAAVAATRFIRRYPIAVTVVYATNADIAAAVLVVYAVLAPDGRGGDWRLLAALVVGAAYLLARLATRLAFLSSAMALVERRLAHAEYTAPPLPVWPDSPAAEAIENAALLRSVK